jgi:hypothetical protein
MVGRRNGQLIYGLSLEWPLAFAAAIAAVSIHLLLSRDGAYLLWIREGKNRETIGDVGVYLFTTIGALAFSKVRQQRGLRILCLVSASLGLCMACFKIVC